MFKIEKISSGIKNLDPLLGGGFPQGSLITYYGSAGTGKTICSLFFLLDGLKKDERVLFVTFEEGEQGILKLAKNLGIDLQKYLENKSLVFRDFSSLITEKGLERSVIDKIKEGNIKRVVIDSLTTAIIDNVRITCAITIKKFIRNFFKTLRSEDVTYIIISRDELEYETAVGLTDCAIYFRPHLIGDQGLSSCTITKIRLSKHNKKVQYIDITKKGEVSIRI